jgi:hypothetical protein
MLGFPLGILSAAGAGGVVSAGSYELIESYILGSSQSSVTFSSLGTYSSTYKHLQLRMTARQDSNSNVLQLRMNGDTGTNYRNHRLTGTGSTVVSGDSGAGTSIYTYTGAASGDTANVFSANVMDLLDAFSTTKNKTIRQLATNGVGIYDEISLDSGAWFNTASITSLQILPATSNWIAGSRFSLYGIKG